MKDKPTFELIETHRLEPVGRRDVIEALTVYVDDGQYEKAIELARLTDSGKVVDAIFHRTVVATELVGDGSKVDIKELSGTHGSTTFYDLEVVPSVARTARGESRATAHIGLDGEAPKIAAGHASRVAQQEKPGIVSRFFGALLTPLFGNNDVLELTGSIEASRVVGHDQHIQHASNTLAKAHEIDRGWRREVQSVRKENPALNIMEYPAPTVSQVVVHEFQAPSHGFATTYVADGQHLHQISYDPHETSRDTVDLATRTGMSYAEAEHLIHHSPIITVVGGKVVS